MKKTALALTILTLLALAATAPALADTEGPYTYTIDNGAATIIKCDQDVVDMLTIPNELGGYPVVAIAGDAFSFCSSITSITIPDSVTNIGYLAFHACASLTSITIPASVSDIGECAFWSCDSLTAVYFDGDALAADNNAFSDSPATLYYLPGASGWDTTFSYRPTAQWLPCITSTSRNLQNGKFRLSCFWSIGQPVAIQATTSLTAPQWQDLHTTTIPASGTIDYEDPDTTTHPSRFYRLIKR